MSDQPSFRQLASRLLIVGGIWTLAHVGVALHVIGLLGLTTGPARALGWSAVLVLAWLPLVALVVGRRPPAPASRVLEWTGFVAMGLSSMLIVFFLVSDVLRVPAWGFGAPRVGFTIIMGSALLTMVGVIKARRPKVVRVAVPIQHLPPDLTGLRIVQLSDLHVGPTIRRRFIQAVVDRTNRLDPDLIAVTGDVADGYVPELRDHVAPLAGLRAPLGTFFVTGNHEYYWDPRGWMRELERLGIDVLSNEHRLLQRGNGRLLLAGVTDLSAASNPHAAMRGAPASDVRVLLAHQPKSAFAAQDAGFDLQLSGHTHGGQFFPFNLLVRLFQPFVAGLHRLEAMWLYVSRGTGYWGPPLRLGAPSEITLIELVPAV